MVTKYIQHLIQIPPINNYQLIQKTITFEHIILFYLTPKNTIITYKNNHHFTSQTILIKKNHTHQIINQKNHNIHKTYPHFFHHNQLIENKQQKHQNNNTKQKKNNFK